MKKNVLLTFDYELSLGKQSGTVENCMIKPTNLILALLKKYEAKAIFFIDTTYLAKLLDKAQSNSKAKIDFESIENQIIQMANDGHYVFHHLHPHWLDSCYVDELNQWDLSITDKYTLYQTPLTEHSLLFYKSHNILQNILQKSKTINAIDGYRAGGLYIEPFELFKKEFIKHNIKYEFSVVPGLKKTNNQMFYDFSKAPKKVNYLFEEEAGIEDPNGRFIQFPISTFELYGLLKILNGLYYRMFKLDNDKFSDGYSVSSEFNNDDNQNNNSFWKSDNILSLELLNPIILFRYKQLIKNEKFLHFLSHPKLMSVRTINEFEKLLQYFSKIKNIEYDFKKML